jgi:hypothetical protein
VAERATEKESGGFQVQGMKAKNPKRRGSGWGKGVAREEENGAMVWRRKKIPARGRLRLWFLKEIGLGLGLRFSCVFPKCAKFPPLLCVVETSIFT